jgi:hypothetical protein
MLPIACNIMSGQLTLKKTLNPIPFPLLGEGKKISVFFLLPPPLHPQRGPRASPCGRGGWGVRGICAVNQPDTILERRWQ